jgi:hypothetical protein
MIASSGEAPEDTGDSDTQRAMFYVLCRSLTEECSGHRTEIIQEVSSQRSASRTMLLAV